jgi:hypothetical protein
VLILLYVGTQLASSLMMQAPTMDHTQRRMRLLLPLFFVIFIINLPAGLILYWITTEHLDHRPAVGDPEKARAGRARRPGRSRPLAWRPRRPGRRRRQRGRFRWALRVSAQDITVRPLDSATRGTET